MVYSGPANVFEIAECNTEVLTDIVRHPNLFHDITVERAKRELERRGVCNLM